MINNVIVFDGTTEFKEEDIKPGTPLRILMNTALNLGGYASIYEKINAENGTAYITTGCSSPNMVCRFNKCEP